VSDLTGIPDLFARIKPTLRGLVPFKKTPKEVTELKPWARFVVTLWVLTVIPVLLYLFGMMVLSAPRILATGWDSLFLLKGKLSSQMSDGSIAEAAISGIQMVFIVLPVLGMGVTFARVSKRVVTGFWNFTSGHPFGRVALGSLGLAAVAAAAYLLIPNGEYKPIQPGEDWTFADSVTAASEATTGRPALTVEQEEDLNARFFNETGEDPLAPSEDPSTDPTSGEDPAGEPPGGAPVEESTPEPTPTPEETAATPEATPTI
jgi:putative peptide zinc metalloprotease protein